ncbi:MAG TPA: thiamine pyrophosphate-dependent dehydrogenase E1 component subunit alpha [Candidatus Limnocylindria bacterium]|jgi:2-oxoisovalerate dehydrogenase E1 component alpha subunit
MSTADEKARQVLGLEPEPAAAGPGNGAEAQPVAPVAPVAPAAAARAAGAEAPHRALGLTDEDVLAMYRQVLIARAVDERMWLMQRAGKIAFIISVQGHEVAQVGIAWSLRKGHDWMAPFYRSIAAAMTFGMTPEDIITAHLAKGDDLSSGGRQMPGHYGAAPHNILSVSSPVGTQVLHAVGLGLGAWVRGDDAVAYTAFGEGTANQGEVHEAMNFAGVHNLPVIFVCENNGYAISVPLERQVGGGSIAARAIGYGFPGVEVDGNDLLACYAAGKAAHERARSGGGPTLIEAHVARLTSHSSDDDQRRYRDPAEVEALKEQDPIPRLAASLQAWGILDAAADEALRAEVKTQVAEAAGRAEARPDPDPATVLRHVYADGS